MPNWCNNKLEIRGNKKDLEEFSNNIKCENSLIDYRKIIPKDKFIKEQKDKWNLLEEEEKEKWNKFKNEIEDGFGLWSFNNGGYEWNKHMWSCKWNCTCENLDKGKSKYIYYFDSPWTPPYKVICKMIEMYPKLRFKFTYREFGNGFEGSIEGKKGKVTKEDFNDLEFASCIVCKDWIYKKSKSRLYICENCGSKFSKKEEKEHLENIKNDNNK